MHVNDIGGMGKTLYYYAESRSFEVLRTSSHSTFTLFLLCMCNWIMLCFQNTPMDSIYESHNTVMPPASTNNVIEIVWPPNHHMQVNIQKEF